ncbi:YuzB family protein [Ectobacillus polymachus]|uniref:YuzB family protein n=1 Tax=Ectobacillus polymachus TaxID=1508806 RepID=UPI003A850DA5
MIKPLIEFCVSNLANGSQQARAVLEKDSNLDVIEYGCLGHCGICYEGPYALVNGEVVSGTTPDELVENIYEYLEENEIF